MATKEFSAAFKKARSEQGANGVFTFNGKLYNTRTKEDQDRLNKPGNTYKKDADEDIKEQVRAAQQKGNDLPEVTVKAKRTNPIPVAKTTKPKMENGGNPMGSIFSNLKTANSNKKMY